MALHLKGHDNHHTPACRRFHVSPLSNAVVETRGASAHSNSYPTVPDAVATSSTGFSAPHKVTRVPTCASGNALISTHSMSIDTRPTVPVNTTPTRTGVPLG